MISPNPQNEEVRVSNQPPMDGVGLHMTSVAVGPAFLFREGVQYGHAVGYLYVVLRLSEAEAHDQRVRLINDLKGE